METRYKIQSEIWVSWAADEISYVSRNFFTSTSQTWNCWRSPARGTLRRLLPAWDGILAALKSLANSWLALLGPWCWAVPSDEQETQRQHNSTSQCSRTHITHTTQAPGPKAELFKCSRITGKTQLLTSNSNIPQNHKSRWFLLSFGISEWYKIHFLKWDTRDGGFSTLSK